MSRVAVAEKLLFLSCFIIPKSPLPRLPLRRVAVSAASPLSTATVRVEKKAKRRKNNEERNQWHSNPTSSPPPLPSPSSKGRPPLDHLLKRRTRSAKDLDEQLIRNFGDQGSHIPVMLGEVLDVFAPSPAFPHLHSFVDCTIGAAGHSSAILQAHPELQVFVGLDVDPVAHLKAQAQINNLLHGTSMQQNSDVKIHMFMKNYKEIKQAIHEADKKLSASGVDGILMDLGVSSMQVDDAERGFSILHDGPLDMRMNPQATLKAEDILNFWPPDEIGRILKEYGEESNWYHLQNKIMQARQQGGLHSTRELVELIRANSRRREVRQGWIKTASRVFQALRIAVNDELKTLEDSVGACFDSLRSGGRLAVISFHSLEDRIVKQTFLGIINGEIGKRENEESERKEDDIKQNLKDNLKIADNNDCGNRAWIKRTVEGNSGVILTKRPITPSVEEERLNVRCRSAKLRVLQKT